MFSKISRYRKLPYVVVDDARRGTLASKALRLLPDVTGTFQHTVEEAERLDHLGFKYYQQPRKWWRICDSNPMFFLSFYLLGKGLLRTVRYSVALPGWVEPSWAAATKALSARLGVESFRFDDQVRLTPEPQTIDGRQVTINVVRHELAVAITYNELLLSPFDLTKLISDAGLPVVQPQITGQVGKRITIPPDVVS